MLMTIEHVMLEEKPDIALVYGDTNSTLAGALAASKLHIPVAHVEAGLRSFDMRMPEEINRILTDRISSWLFTPTQTATDNLRKEGTPQAHVAQTGDVMYDVALNFADKVSADGRLLSQLRLKPHHYILATIHRAENTDSRERLSLIVDYLRAVSTTILPIIWPLHPRTRGSLEDAGLLEAVQNSVTLVPPTGYLDMVQLEKYSALIMTDSGGVQKEAFFYEVPCITLRDRTEWTELVDSGWNHLVPPLSGNDIIDAVRCALSNKPERTSPYGDGDAARKIVSILARV
jgi:UDP-GlcNAc3NAcA epimerase